MSQDLTDRLPPDPLAEILAEVRRLSAGQLAMSERLERVEEAVAARSKETRPMSERIDQILSEVVDVKARVGGIEERMGRLEGDVRALRHATTSNVAVLERAQTALEERLGRIEEERAR